MSSMQSKRCPTAGVEPEYPPQEVTDRLAGLLPEGALDEAVQGLRADELTGSGGLLSQLAGRVLEAALAAELTEHLGHPPGATPAAGNVRNGGTAKRVSTDLGPVEVRTPRDRDRVLRAGDRREAPDPARGPR
jgi:transposase-like protein